MHIEYFGWNARKSINVKSKEDAEEIIRSQYPDAFVNDTVDFYEGSEFFLVWESEEEAKDDDGKNAVAKIVVIEEVA